MQRLLTVSRIMGYFSLMFSVSMVVPILVSLAYDDGEARSFFYSLLIALFIGGVLTLA